MFNITGGEIVIILIVALVILGPDRIPEVARSAGRMINKVKSFTEGMQSSVSGVMDDPSMQPLKDLTELAARPRQKLAEYALEAEAEERARQEAAKAAEAPEPVESVEPAEAADPVESVEPAEAAEPVESVEPAEDAAATTPEPPAAAEPLVATESAVEDTPAAETTALAETTTGGTAADAEPAVAPAEAPRSTSGTLES